MLAGSYFVVLGLGAVSYTHLDVYKRQIYNSGNYKLAFSPAMQETLQVHQQNFMQEDAQAGMIYALSLIHI